MPLNALGASLVRKFWILFVIVLMLLAVYVSVGRMVMPRLENYQPQLEEILSDALGLQVSAEHLQGGWLGFNPTIALQRVSLKQADADDPKESEAQAPVLEIEKLTVQLDVLTSLLSRQAVFSSLVLQGMTLELQQQPEGRWRMPGWPEKSRDPDKDPLDWLLSQGEMLLMDVGVVLRPQNAEAKALQIPSWGLRCGLMVCSSQGRVLWQADRNELNFSLNIFEKPAEKNFRLEGYFSTAPVQLTDWMPFFKFDHPLVNDIQSLAVGAEVWFDWREGELQDMRGTLDIPNIELGRQHEAMSAIDFLRTDFSWLRDSGQDNEQWALWLNDLTFKYAGEVFEPAQRRVSLLEKNGDQVARLIADRMALEPIVSTLMTLDSLPEKVRAPLNALQPSGALKNLQVEYRLPAEGKENRKPWFKIESQLENVSISAWRHVPAIQNVSGYLEVQPDRGQVDLDAKNFALHFPRVYSNNWQFESASGVVNWLREGKTLWLDGRDLYMSGALGELKGRFRSLSSKDGLEPRLSLLIGLEKSHLPDALDLVPDVVSSPKLLTWLNQAFDAGDINSARFVLEQKVKKGASPITRTLAMDVDASAVDFSFHPDWPHLTEAKVNVGLRDQQVAVQASEARLFDMQLGEIDAFYEGRREAARLRATTTLNGPLQDAWRVLTETPLQKNLFALGKDFQFSGELSKGHLKLDIPFGTPGKTDVELAFSTQNAQLEIPTVGVDARSIRGDFQYSQEQGLTASKATAELFGFPAKVAITAKKTSTGNATELKLEGHLKTPSLAAWVPRGLLDRLAGETGFSAELLVGRGAESYLRIDSLLNGVSLDMPVPMGKTADEAARFSLNMSLLEPRIHKLSYSNGYGDQFSYALSFGEGGYQDGQIKIGPDRAVYQTGKDIQVKGHLPELDYQQWFGVFEQMQSVSEPSSRQSGVAGSFINRIGNVQLETDVFRFLNEDYQQVTFDALQQHGDWRIRFDNVVAKGELAYFKDPEQPLAVDFDYLAFSDAPVEAGAESNAGMEAEYDQAKIEAPEKDALADVLPQDLPALDLKIKTLMLAGDPFGRWAFKLRPQPGGVRLEALDFKLKGVQAKGEVSWLYADGSHHSEFSGDVLIPDVAEMLEAWNKPAAIVGENAVFKGQMSWAGSPANFSLLRAQGPMSVETKQGRIIDMTSLRLLGVLNFNSLSRRLRLDFSDLFKKGFSFDRVEGKLRFNEGQMSMAESLVIDGPAAKFKIDGSTDLLNEQFDHDVIVVLPVKDNIPVIATLAGFPQVGVPIYLFNRAFGDMLDRFTSANYRVTGSWDDPDIKLSSFFDSQDLPESSRPPPKQGRRKR